MAKILRNFCFLSSHSQRMPAAAVTFHSLSRGPEQSDEVSSRYELSAKVIRMLMTTELDTGVARGPIVGLRLLVLF